jgi:hypothetical protein
MNEKLDKWLDEQLDRIVNSGKVEFNSEQWKQKFSDAHQTLVSRAAKRADVRRFSWGRQLIRIAAIVAVAALVMFFTYRKPDERVVQPIAAGTDRSPAKMLSVLSLSMAYRQGGLDAVDEQCKKAFKLLGQKNTNVSIGELLNENNGNKPERNDL